MPPYPSKRLYLRNLPKYVSEATLLKHLSSYGKIIETKIVHDYAFVQFELEKDAQDVLETFRHQPFLGKGKKEFAHPLRKGISSVAGNDLGERLAIAYAQSRYPIVVTNLPRRIRWQELKDFGKISGSLVAYCDLDKKRRGRGFIEYFSKEDAQRAVQELNGMYLGGKRVKVSVRPEVSSRGRRSRSRSPARRNEELQHYTPEKYPIISQFPNSDITYSGYRRDLPPPSYEHHNSYYYSQQPPSTRHCSSSCTSIERVQTPTTHCPPTYLLDSAYYKEQYDYAGHSIRLNTWKYNYDLDRYDNHYDPPEVEQRVTELPYRYHDY